MSFLPAGKLPASLLKALLDDVRVSDDVIVGPGIGRDAAAVRVGDHILVMKTDPITFPTDDPGWYLVHINANDIACMGASPRWLLVTALLPENATTPSIVESMFASLMRSCAEVGCELIGGHTEITEALDRPILVGQMIGTTTGDTLIDPRTARPGDAVLLIGGIAIEGTSILASEAADQFKGTISDGVLRRASEFASSPGVSVVPYARRLTENDRITVRALHDPTEGGLATGLDEIAQATNLGIEIHADSVHVYSETAEITATLGLDPWGLIASGALLAVVPDDDVPPALAALEDQSTPIARIGKLTENADERTLIVNGERQRLPEFSVDEIARFFATR